ncbi:MULTISPECIES: 5-oxoprolinase subunit PxpA [Flavobacteriaceae]|uniref:5-oxoprolinase subunit PxpA n=1 Tax=Flavobacteriaceae TaxID=49546 RepID=UPI001492FB68|nr:MULTISPECIES: 5-oxoprolinase subunit PxpA [Allomuricauda]MDC6364812.1 5-oxoprolinase subunit PxpA [Muricauda sp. AC10]
METWSIDINCDVGEGIGNEAELFSHISSCNIACGGHAGDAKSMKDIVQLAKQNKIKIGAHPSYPDRLNFGRVTLDISALKLIESIREQLKNFNEALKMGEAELHHIKAHGALYNDTAKNINLAKIYLNAVEAYKDKAILYVPSGSVIAKEAKKEGFQIWYEAFADRNYNDDLSLVSRKKENALIVDPKKVLKHILLIIKESKVMTEKGHLVEIFAKTLCIHGDTSSALEILTYLSHKLPKHQVQLQK